MNKYLLLLMIMPVLASCSIAPKPTLDETLNGKSKVEQHAILQQECLKMAQEKRSSYSRHYYVSLEQRQRKIDVCNKMSEEMK